MSFITKALKKVGNVLKDSKTVATNMSQAQQAGQPLTKEQILKNTSMAPEPKPPSAPTNTSGRPPVAPTGPTPEPANLNIAPGSSPWDKSKPAAMGTTGVSGPIASFKNAMNKAGEFYGRATSANPWDDKYKLGRAEQDQLDQMLAQAKGDRRAFNNAVTFQQDRQNLDSRKADRLRREFDRRRR
jgi:hypothetical protein